MKRQISFVAIFITFFVTSVAGAQVRISNTDMKQINKVNLGQGCWMSVGKNGVFSNWGSDSRVLKMQHEKGDLTMAVACGKPKVTLAAEFRDLITIRIQNEGLRPGDFAALTRIVFSWKAGKNPVGRKIPITVETLTGKRFRLTLKTGSSSKAATLTALAAGKTAENAEKLAEKAYGGVEYRGGGRGIKLSLGGFWAFNTEGKDGYGSFLDVFAKVKTLSPKTYFSVGAMLSWHQYQLYFIHAPTIKNPEVPATELDFLAKGRINFVLADRFELFAGLGLGGRSFAHSDSIGTQTDLVIHFTNSSTAFEAVLGAEVGINIFFTEIFGISVFYQFDISLTEQIINPSSFQSVPRNMGHSINHKLNVSLLISF